MLCQPGPSGDLFKTSKNGCKSGLREDISGRFEQTIQDETAGMRRGSFYPKAFIGQGHKECLASSLAQRVNDRFDSATIGVCLDHGCTFGRACTFAKQSPIGHKGIEIDGQSATGEIRVDGHGSLEAFRQAVFVH